MEELSIPERSSFDMTNCVGVIGLTRVRSSWEGHVAAELARVLHKLAPSSLVVFPDSVGAMAALWAADHELACEVVWPGQDRRQYVTDPDDNDRKNPLFETALLRCSHHHHITRDGVQREGWFHARRYITDTAQQYVLVHDQRNSGMPAVLRCAQRGTTIVVRPDGGQTVRWLSHPDSKINKEEA